MADAAQHFSHQLCQQASELPSGAPQAVDSPISSGVLGVVADVVPLQTHWKICSQRRPLVF
jgi:hypothetical protein